MARFILGIFLLGSLSFASPLYPWEDSGCVRLKQSDDKWIGSICSKNDSELGVGVINVYYFGHLYQDRDKYSSFYVNFSIDGKNFWRRGLKPFTSGDGNNLPKREVMFGRFIATHNLQGSEAFPVEKEFQVFFQAEEKKPTKSPPFQYDSDFEKNYRGKVPKILY